MKSTIESSTGLKRILKIEVDSEAVKKAFEKEFNKVRQNVTLPGFRKGKAPMDKIKASYKANVTSDVVENLVNQNYFEALKQHDLYPVSLPKIDLDKIDEEKGFSFTAELEIKPEVVLKKYTNFEIKKEEPKIDESRIQTVIDQILNSKAERVAVLEDRPAADKDFVDINFEGFIGSDPLPNGTANNFMLELGSNSFIPGFEPGIIGMKIGSDKTIELKFPEDYHAADVAGKDVHFKVKLNKIMKKQLPELTDELIASLGDTKVKTVDGLKESIKEDLSKSEESRIQKNVQEDVLKKLIEANPVELPESLVAEQKENLKKNSSETLKQQGLDDAAMEDYFKKWDDDFSKNARDIIHSSLIMDAIANKENLRPTEDEVKNKISEIAKNSGMEEKKVKEFYSDPNRMDSLAYRIMEDRVIDYIMANSKLS